jgi:hypothetical protein
MLSNRTITDNEENIEQELPTMWKGQAGTPMVGIYGNRGKIVFVKGGPGRLGVLLGLIGIGAILCFARKRLKKQVAPAS